MSGRSKYAPSPREHNLLLNLVEMHRSGEEWTPAMWDEAEAIAEEVFAFFERVARNSSQAVAAGRPKAPKAPKAVRAREEGWWSFGAAKKVVHQRSGGDCELRSPYCKGRATNVHHAFGRRGDDPHHPDRLLDLCGMGNIDGCHGWAHGAYGGGGREAAQAVCHGFAAERGESL